jgi:hypothetical protein
VIKKPSTGDRIKDTAGECEGGRYPGRIGAREYDGWPGRPSYQVAGGWVRMWLPGTRTSTPPDQLMTIEQLVRKMFPDIAGQHIKKGILYAKETGPLPDALFAPPQSKEQCYGLIAALFVFWR